MINYHTWIILLWIIYMIRKYPHHILRLQDKFHYIHHTFHHKLKRMGFKSLKNKMCYLILFARSVCLKWDFFRSVIINFAQMCLSYTEVEHLSRSRVHQNLIFVNMKIGFILKARYSNTTMLHSYFVYHSFAHKFHFIY